MGNADLDVKDIIIDCYDSQRVAEFWSRLLNRPITTRIGPYVWLERVNGLSLGFQKVAAPTIGKKNRLHLDLASANPAAAQQRVESLGGRRLPQYTAGGFLVMADPEGNEFCIIPREPFDVDEQGHTSYLHHPETPPTI